MKKTRILATGDFHGSSFLAEKLAKNAEEEQVDLVIICGDITHFGQECQNVIRPFMQRQKKVLFVPGNHDPINMADFLAEFYGVKNLHGYSITHNNIGIFGCGGAENLGPVNALSEDEMLYTIKKAHKGIENLERKILVTHMHPSNSKVEKLSGFSGSKAIRKAITEHKPELLLCCHIHELEGIEEIIENTKVINVGRSGKIIEF